MDGWNPFLINIKKKTFFKIKLEFTKKKSEQTNKNYILSIEFQYLAFHKSQRATTKKKDIRILIELYLCFIRFFGISITICTENEQ